MIIDTLKAKQKDIETRVEQINAQQQELQNEKLQLVGEHNAYATLIEEMSDKPDATPPEPTQETEVPADQSAEPTTTPEVVPEV